MYLNISIEVGAMSEIIIFYNFFVIAEIIFSRERKGNERESDEKLCFIESYWWTTFRRDNLFKLYQVELSQRERSFSRSSVTIPCANYAELSIRNKYFHLCDDRPESLEIQFLYYKSDVIRSIMNSISLTINSIRSLYDKSTHI